MVINLFQQKGVKSKCKVTLIYQHYHCMQNKPKFPNTRHLNIIGILGNGPTASSSQTHNLTSIC